MAKHYRNVAIDVSLQFNSLSKVIITFSLSKKRFFMSAAHANTVFTCKGVCTLRKCVLIILIYQGTISAKFLLLKISWGINQRKSSW